MNIRQYGPWLCFLVVFYGAWAAYFLASDTWHLLGEHWPIALSMALGSYFAGSTPMGGGTVGFPVLVFGFDYPTHVGRDFSLAVQSIGMTSASLLIWCRKQALARTVLQGSIIGVTLGLPIGLFAISPWVSEFAVKALFSVLWASFGIYHLRYGRELRQQTGFISHHQSTDLRVGLLLGMIGGLTTVAFTGVGIDMLVYSTLILMYRANIAIAIPTSVVIMAYASVYGSVFQTLTGAWSPGVIEQWLTAAPVVALGAPLGVLVVSRLAPRTNIAIVSVLCLAQFAWFLLIERQYLSPLSVLLLIVLAATTWGLLIKLKDLSN